MSALPTACVIGAGSSGIAAVKALPSAGYDVTAYEKSDRVGGNWVFGNTNGMSSAYRSLHINTSRERMEYSDFPMPKSYPDFPHHTAHRGVLRRLRRPLRLPRPHPLRDRRRARARAAPTACGRSRSTTARRERYDALLVANGHHWDPRWPEPAFPGADDFEGVQIHSHDYRRRPRLLPRQDRRRARDGQLARWTSRSRRASWPSTRYLAARRGAHVAPQVPASASRSTSSAASPQIPFAVRPRGLAGRCSRSTSGDMERYGLPKPDHRFGDAHPTVSDDILVRIAHGTITAEAEHRVAERRPRALRRRLGGQADVVVYCTGYKVTFPFFDEGFISAPDNDLPLFRRVFHPDDRRTCSSSGCCSRSARSCRSPRRSRQWVADYLAGEYALPSPARAAGGHRARAARDVQALRRLQAPHDAGRLRRLPGRAGQGAQGGRGARAGAGYRLPVPPRAGARSRRDRGRARRRPPRAHEGGQPRRDPRRGADVFAELGYGAASVRDIVRRTDLAAGTFYNYFPDKEAVFRALVHEVGEEARRRVRAARRAARTPREFVEDAYRAYFGFIVEDAAARRLPAPQRRHDPRDVRGVRGAGRDRRAGGGPARGDRARRAAGGRRRLLRGARWSPSALELGQRLVERDPPDVEGATRFATQLFLGGVVSAAR